MVYGGRVDMSPLLEIVLLFGGVFIVGSLIESWNIRSQLIRLEKRIERLEKKK